MACGAAIEACVPIPQVLWRLSKKNLRAPFRQVQLLQNCVTRSIMKTEKFRDTSQLPEKITF